MKTTGNRTDIDSKSVTQLPVSTIRGMCPGINTDVLNEVEDTQAAEHLITPKATARVASLERARKITLDDL